MKAVHLAFEQGPQLLEDRVRGLRDLQASTSVDLQPEIEVLQDKVESAWQTLYHGLTPWQVVQVARHPQRPYTLDYIDALCTDFVELHGDRAGHDDGAIVAGLARFEGRPIVVMGHQKGRDLKERTRRNFGMPRPEGYRKAMRIMELAEQFGLPLVTFIDTPGAFPGIDAEERGQSAAIGQSIYRMSQLNVPTVSLVIGEGGSGGALAIGVADVVAMLEYSVYSVISPEGCASILWKDAAHAESAAVALGVTARQLQAQGLVDDVVVEPNGGAHRDPAKAAEYVGRTLRAALERLRKLPPAQRMQQRQRRLRTVGAFEEVVS